MSDPAVTLARPDTSRALRPSVKALPEHARAANRALVLQTLYTSGSRSRADLARDTGLTRVTISDLVSDLIGDELVVAVGRRPGTGPGKPATLVDIDRAGLQLIGMDLSEHGVFRGALLDLDGTVLCRNDSELHGATGEAAVAIALRIAERLLAAVTGTVLGIGVGSPGVVDATGTVRSAPNLGWVDEHLQERMATATGHPVLVTNDANAAALAEHSFGGALADMILVRIGHGVGAGLLLGGVPLSGSRNAAGEIGHVVVGTDGGARCACGKRGCLETWLAAPRLEAALTDAVDDVERDEIRRRAGERLGIALAPVVGALDLAEIVLSGPAPLLDGPLAAATLATLRARTMSEFHDHVVLRRSMLGRDIVMRGAAAMVLSGRLGVS